MEFNRFDVSAKELVWDDPAAWLERFAIGPRGPVEVIDSDITTLTASADKVLRVGGPDPYLVDLEPHSYHDTGLTRTLWFRQVALDYRHDLPVLTVLILLCKEANAPGLTGTYERQLPDGWQTNRYNYQVVRLWQEDPEPYLTAQVNLVPLAPPDQRPGVGRGVAGPSAAHGGTNQRRAAAAGGETLDGDVSAHGVTLLRRTRVSVVRRSAEHAGIDHLSSHLARRPAGREGRGRTRALATSGDQAVRRAGRHDHRRP